MKQSKGRKSGRGGRVSFFRKRVILSRQSEGCAFRIKDLLFMWGGGVNVCISLYFSN